MIHRRLGQLLIPLLVALLIGVPSLAAPGSGAQPQAVSVLPLAGQDGGRSLAVAVEGTLAYLGIGPSVGVIDISAPAAPTRVGHSAALADLVEGVAASGGMVYAVAGASGLQIIDATVAASPVLKGAYDTPGTAVNVAVSGAYAYVADAEEGLRVVNVTDPLAPVPAGYLVGDPLGEVRGIAIDGTTAYLGAGTGGLAIVDISNPASLSLLGQYSDAELVAANVAVAGTTAYVVDSHNLRVLAIDVSDTAAPAAFDETYLTDTPDDLAVLGDYLYVSVGAAGLDVFELDPATGAILNYQGTFDTPGEAHDVALASPYAYIADAPTGLQVVDVVTTPGSPAAVGAYETLGDALGLATAGTYAYVAAGEQGLSVMSIATLSGPVRAGSVDTIGYAQSVAVSGTLGYVSDGPGGLAVVNVATPASPSVVGQVALPGDAYAWASAVQGSYAYVAGDSAGLQIVNVSSPGSPALVDLTAFVQPADPVTDVVLQGSTAFLAAGAGGVRVVDVTNPAAPVELASIPTTDSAWQLDLTGGLLYIADIDGGLIIVNVSTPSSPVPVTAYTGTLGPVVDVTVSGSYALVTTGDQMAVLDVSVPSSPFPRATHATAGTPQAVAVAASGGVLLTDLDGGLRVLDPLALGPMYRLYLPLIRR